MEPAIPDGAVLVISRIRYGIRLPWQQKYLILWAKPKVGEIVVFYTPAGEQAVKRCIALLEPFNQENKIRGYLFLAEGDNNLSSYDSRSYGPVPVESIIGRVLGY